MSGKSAPGPRPSQALSEYLRTGLPRQTAFKEKKRGTLHTPVRFGSAPIALHWPMAAMLVATALTMEPKGSFPKGSAECERLKTSHYLLGAGIFAPARRHLAAQVAPHTLNANRAVPWLTIHSDGPPRMVKRPNGSGGEPSSPNCGASAGGKARHLFLARCPRQRLPATGLHTRPEPRCVVFIPLFSRPAKKLNGAGVSFFAANLARRRHSCPGPAATPCL